MEVNVKYQILTNFVNSSLKTNPLYILEKIKLKVFYLKEETNLISH